MPSSILGEGRARTTNGKRRDQITVRPADPDKQKVGPACCVAEKLARRVGLCISSRRPCVISVVHDCCQYALLCQPTPDPTVELLLEQRIDFDHGAHWLGHR